ncbi:MAG: HAD family phosphatase [Acidobacteria bacterium]|nr:HAD family phosphatase [Acidobacteriota bacterium]
MALNHRFKAVLLDLGKVIIPFDFERGYRALEPLCGYKAAEIPAQIRATGLVEQFESGRIAPAAFVEQLSAALNLRIDYARFCEIWTSVFLPDPLLPESLLEGLRARYRLVLLSNTNAIHFEMIRERYPLLRHFHDYVLSYEVKAMKPAPEIFRAAIERAGCRAEECFFTDDIERYVEGARREGIDAVQFQSREQLERELAARGIAWE